ncbi:MAG: SLBB domain-containing protein [Desulfuromonadaceae bacterium]|nr:SLBB domain-containing protein [Desulfuromonadaceae bacterium]
MKNLLKAVATALLITVCTATYIFAETAVAPTAVAPVISAATAVGIPSSQVAMPSAPPATTTYSQGAESAFGKQTTPLSQVPEGSGEFLQNANQKNNSSLNSSSDGQQVVSDIVSEPSAVEAAMIDSVDYATKTAPQKFTLKRLTQFGYNFFQSAADPFVAVSDIPVGPDYILGAGDRINLTIWGGIDASLPLEVNRNGEVVIPKVGPVQVAGVTFGKLPQLLTGQLSRIYRNFELSVTMGKLRMIKVYVVGNVKAPGDYNISSMSTLLNALSAAGGPSRNGSLRSIAIKRDGKLVDTVDLYEFFLKGDKSRDIRLQSGDTVFIPSLGSVVGVSGNVRRPAIFELKNEKTLKDLLDLADGIVSTGYLQRLQILRVDANVKRSVVDVNLEPQSADTNIDSLAADIPIKDMDLVKIFPIDSTVRGYVRLAGYVLRPGDYAIKPGMKLADLLPPDNLLPEYHQNIGTINRLVAPSYQPEMIVINPAKAIAGEADFNLELKEFDTVTIYSKWDMEEMPYVRVSGEVQKPGQYRLLKGMTVRDLIYSSGNVKMTAFLKNAEISRMQRSTDNVSMSSLIINLDKALKNDPENNITLLPFDELSVRKIPSWTEEVERYVTLAGEFRFPGIYPIYKGEKLSSIINRAGGFTDKAYLRGAKFTRRSVMEQQQKRMDDVLSKTEADLFSKKSELASIASSKSELDATLASMEGLKKNIDRLKTLKAEGRVVIQLNDANNLSTSEYDLLLEGGDKLFIPPRPGVVNVMGQVYNPTSFIYQPDNSVENYLNKSGGPSKDAETSEMYIIRADGTVYSRQQSSSFGMQWSVEGSHWSFGGFLSSSLGAGDTLVVPQKLERTAWMREIKDWTQVLANVAVTAGTVILGLR